MSVVAQPERHQPSTAATGAASWRTLLGAYVNLTKPRIMLLLLITTLASALIAARQYPLPPLDLARVLLAAMLGGALASGGAAALNCYIDRDIDAVMNRTRRRALPSGAVQPWQVLLFGIALSALSVVVLGLLANPLAAVLALIGNLYYVVIYTMWLKRSTTQNIVIGGAAGAIPPLVGWAAVAHTIGLPAVLLFAVIFLWTPAHFWSLALINRKDYAAVKVPMLPAVAGERYTKWRILAYTVLVVLATLALYLVHAMGIFYLAAAVALGSGFLYMAARLLQDKGHGRARRTFMYSNIYLALLFFAMVVDRVIPLH